MALPGLDSMVEWADEQPVRGRRGGSGAVVTTTERAPDAVASPAARRAWYRTRRLPAPAGRPLLRAVDGPDALPMRHAPPWERRHRLVLVLLDLGLVAVASVIAFVTRFGAQGAADAYLVGTLVLPPAWVAVVALGRGYESRFLGTGPEEYRRLFDAGLRLFAVTAGSAYALKVDVARGYLFVAFPVALLLTVAGRLVARRLLGRLRALGRCTHAVVAVGSERSVAELITTLTREPRAGFRVVAACVAGRDGAAIEGVPVLGDPAGVVAALRVTGADTVAVTAWSTLGPAELRRLSWELEGSGVDLVVAPSVTDIAGPRISIRPVAGLPLLHVEEPEFSGSRRLVKTALDRSVAAVALVVFSPVLVVSALVVRLGSRGPALFRQTRVGVDGTSFTMLKLRSMHTDAEQRLHDLAEGNDHGTEGMLFKLRQDPRVTPVGRFLRRYSLDELPQLINVLRGDMSLVGPRPPLPTEVDRYADDARRRLLVKPGLTGLWQVSGRSDLSWEESVRLDLHYVENWTLALDLVILWRTFAAVVGRRGAY